VSQRYGTNYYVSYFHKYRAGSRSRSPLAREWGERHRIADVVQPARDPHPPARSLRGVENASLSLRDGLLAVGVVLKDRHPHRDRHGTQLQAPGAVCGLSMR
jgi:hypothetical protein